MWSNYETFQAGIHHITEIDAYDHMCYLLAMIAGLSWVHWKKLLALASAFTVGHSITLVLGGLNLVHFSSEWVEILIAASIFVTGLFRFTSKSTPPEIRAKDYVINMTFGLVHGMGFSQTIRMMMDENNAAEHAKMLFLFNGGVEIGQILVLGVFAMLTWLFTDPFKVKANYLKMAFAGVAAVVGLMLLIERLISVFS